MMFSEIRFDNQCHSLAVASVTHAGIAGGMWGYYCGPYEARNLGLTGGARAFYEAKAVARYGLRCALLAGLCSVTLCELKRYRKKDDWVNDFVAAGLSGLVAGAGYKNWIRTGANFIAYACVSERVDTENDE